MAKKKHRRRQEQGNPAPFSGGQSRLNVISLVIQNNPDAVDVEGKKVTYEPQKTTVNAERVVHSPPPKMMPTNPEIKNVPPTVLATPVIGGAHPDEVWERARLNAEYYLDQAMKDDCRRYWFQYPKFTHQYSEHVLISPQMAQDLFKYAAPNRNIGDQDSDAYRRDFDDGHWIYETHEGIAIDKLLRFFDGQQRSDAIIKSGREWPIYVTWNCDPAAIFVCNSGRKRTVNQKMSLVLPGLKLNGRLTAVCRAMMRGIGQRIKYSESEIAEFAIKHKQVLEWLNEHCPASLRADVQAAIGKGLLFYGEESLIPMCQQLEKTEWKEGDPARALYLFYTNRAKGETPVTVYRKACNAILKQVRGERVERLYEGEDIFEWEPGWEVPGK